MDTSIELRTFESYCAEVEQQLGRPLHLSEYEWVAVGFRQTYSIERAVAFLRRTPQYRVDGCRTGRSLAKDR